MLAGLIPPNNLSTSFYFLSFYQPAGPGFTLSPLAADCNHRDTVRTMLLSSIGRTPVLMPNLGISFNFELFFPMKKLMPGLGISFNRFTALNLVYLTPWGGFRFRQVYDPRYQAGAGATREHTHSGHQVCPCQTRVTPVGIVGIFGHSGKHSRGPTFGNQLRAKRPTPRLATVARRGHIFSLILRLRPQTPPNIVGRWLAPRISCHV